MTTLGKIVSLDARSLEWARGLFARYYAETPVPPPSRFARREFAAFPFRETTMMRRHASLSTEEGFHEFLVREVPRHVYYSSAYYRYPDHPTMAQKEWLGADLIFDLDADHLRGAGSLDLAGQLELVKSRLIDLVDDFLTGDFGIPASSLRLVFSGGRGYHVHVLDPAFWPLNSPERRELVEYIQGSGFDPSDAVVEEKAGRGPVGEGEGEGGAPRRGGSRPTFRRLYPPDAPGWHGRTTRALLRLLDRWESVGWEKAATELEGFGLPRADARRLARQLVEEGRGRRIREGLSLDVFPKGIPKGFLETVLRQAAVEVQGETDAPVTTDIHRLIRLPGSLHGGSGFRVRPLERDALDGFNPWRDAQIPVPSGEARTVELVDTVRYPFEPAPVEGSAGDRATVPTPVALFLVLRGEARIPAGPG